jgi:hypothetical protein
MPCAPSSATVLQFFNASLPDSTQCARDRCLPFTEETLARCGRHLRLKPALRPPEALDFADLSYQALFPSERRIGEPGILQCVIG